MELKDILTILIALFGVILGIVNFYSNQFNMKNEFFKSAISQEMIKCRHHVRTSDKLGMDNMYVVELLNFYNYWGAMVRQKHLPLSVFNSASGFNVVEFFEKLKPLIEKEKEKRHNELYAQDFKWLYDKIKNTYNF